MKNRYTETDTLPQWVHDNPAVGRRIEADPGTFFRYQCQHATPEMAAMIIRDTAAREFTKAWIAKKKGDSEKASRGQY